MVPCPGDIQAILLQLRSNRTTAQLCALRALQHIAATPAGAGALLAAGGVAALLHRLGSSSSEAVKEGALWALATMIQPEVDMQALKAEVLAASAAPLLVRLLESGNEEIWFRAAMLLSMLITDNAERASAAAALGAVPFLVSRLQHARAENVQAITSLAVCELPRVPSLKDALVQCGALAALVPLLLGGSSHPDVQRAAAWAVANLACGSAAREQAVLRAGGVRALVNVLSTGSMQGRAAAAQGIRDMMFGTPAMRAAVAAEGAAPALASFLRAAPGSAAAPYAAAALRLLQMDALAGPSSTAQQQQQPQQRQPQQQQQQRQPPTL